VTGDVCFLSAMPCCEGHHTEGMANQDDQVTVQQVDAWRADTEGCEHVTHLNNAGASLPPRQVMDAQIEHLQREARIGGYEAADEAAGALADTYSQIGRLLNADASEVALIENATRAWDMAFYSLSFERGDQIITGNAEYASNYLAFLHAQQRYGVEIVVCPDDAQGQVNADALSALITDRTRLVAITYLPTNGGLINPAEEIGAITSAHGVTYLLDACQAVGQIPLDVDRLKCDFLSATGRKFLRGPRGTGFLYARTTTTRNIHPAMVDLHAATWKTATDYELVAGAKRFENWESPIAAKIALGVAARYANDIGLDVIEARNAMLARRLRDGLSDVPGVSVRDSGSRQSAIVTLTHDERPASLLKAGLRERGINTSVAGRTGALLDFERRALPEMLRMSVHYFNTDAEIDLAVKTVRTLTS
jgi:cysteine desulfurase / selenocysteine lyase